MKRNIVFLTDCVDIAYSEIRGTVLSELTKANFDGDIGIEPVVGIKPFSIINGAFTLRLMAEAYPPGTVFSVILNPIQKRPERLIGRTNLKEFYFVGANTGVFSWFLRDFGIKDLYELNDPGFLPFGGKYVHAPAASKLAMGIPLSELGHPFQERSLRPLDITEGTIVHIDNFGLIKFVYSLPELKDGQKLTVRINNHVLSAVYTKRMMNRGTGEWVVYQGSSLGLPELGKVRQNGANELGVKEGEMLEIKVNS